MEIGTSTHAIAGFERPGKPFHQALAEIAECGFPHFMLLGLPGRPVVDRSGEAPEAIIDTLKSDLPAVRRTVAAHGLRVSCLYGPLPGELTRQNVAALVRAFHAWRDAAWSLGCCVMVHSAGRLERRTPLKEKADQIDCLAEALTAATSERQGEIFRTAVDIHYSGVIETVEDAEYFLERTAGSGAGLCLNTGHMTTLGENGWELLERHGERVHVVAWKDHLLGPDLPRPVVSTELGRGRTPFEKYVTACRCAGPRCRAVHLVTFEDVPFAEKKAALARSRRYLGRLMHQYGLTASFAGE